MLASPFLESFQLAWLLVPLILTGRHEGIERTDTFSIRQQLTRGMKRLASHASTATPICAVMGGWMYAGLCPLDDLRLFRDCGEGSQPGV